MSSEKRDGVPPSANPPPSPRCSFEVEENEMEESMDTPTSTRPPASATAGRVAQHQPKKRKRVVRQRVKPTWLVKPFNPDTDKLEPDQRLLVVAAPDLGPVVGQASNRRQARAEYEDA